MLFLIHITLFCTAFRFCGLAALSRRRCFLIGYLLKFQIVERGGNTDSGTTRHIVNLYAVTRLCEGQFIAQIVGNGKDLIRFLLQDQLVGDALT